MSKIFLVGSFATYVKGNRKCDNIEEQHMSCVRICIPRIIQPQIRYIHFTEETILLKMVQ